MKDFKLNRILQFIGGIALVVVGILTFFSDALTLNVVTYIVLYSLLLYGILQIGLTFVNKGDSRFGHLILGIVLVALSILALYNIGTASVAILLYAYIFFGIAFMFISGQSLSNHLRTFKDRNLIVSILLILLDVILLVFSITIFFFDPVIELEIISIFISLSLLFAGFAQISDSFVPVE